MQNRTLLKTLIVVCMLFVLTGCAPSGVVSASEAVTQQPFNTIIPAAIVTTSTITQQPVHTNTTAMVAATPSTEPSNYIDTSTTWIKRNYLNVSGLTVELDMPEPGTFPENVYVLDISKVQNMNQLCDRTKLIDIMNVNGRPSNNTLTIDSWISYAPSQRLNYEYIPYPISGIMPSNDNTSFLTVRTDVENGIRIDDWKTCQIDKSLIHAQLDIANQVLQQIGYNTGTPSTLYRSILDDGRSVTEIGLPLVIEQLPMHSCQYVSNGAYETKTRDWGYVWGDCAHFVILDSMDIYYLNIPEFLNINNKQNVSPTIASYQQALQAFVTELSVYLQNKTVVITSINPCYLKHPVEGTNWRYTANPAWEITYYEKIDNAGWFETKYIDATDGKLY